MKALFSETKSELIRNFKIIDNDPAIKSALVLLTNDKDFTDDVLNPILRNVSKSVIGGVFYKLIFDSELKDHGVLIVPLSFTLKTEVFSFDDNDEQMFARLQDKFSEQIKEVGSVFVFTDAFGTRKAMFIEELFNFFGFKYSFVGAGCGSESFVSFPCVLHNSGVHANAAVIGYTNQDINLGVGHGWTPVSVPLKVTESRENEMISLNWEPAFDVYKSVVEEHSGVELTLENFLDIAKSYPIGLMKVDGEMVVRDPFKVLDGTISCLDNIEQGQYVAILYGTSDTLVDGAAKAADACFGTQLPLIPERNTLFCVDCISRVKFLSDDFSDEIKAISGNLVVNGVLSFGEIANMGHSFLEIYNKTIIVAQWEQIH